MKLFLCLNHFIKSSMWNSNRDPKKLLRFDYTSTWTKLLTLIKKSCVNKGKLHGDSKKCSIASWTIWSVKNHPKWEAGGGGRRGGGRMFPSADGSKASLGKKSLLPLQRCSTSLAFKSMQTTIRCQLCPLNWLNIKMWPYPVLAIVRNNRFLQMSFVRL